MYICKYATKTPRSLTAHSASLSEVAAMRSQSQEELHVMFEDDKAIDFCIGSDSDNRANLGRLTVTDVYDERYLIGIPYAQGKKQFTGGGLSMECLSVRVRHCRRSDSCSCVQECSNNMKVIRKWTVMGNKTNNNNNNSLYRNSP